MNVYQTQPRIGDLPVDDIMAGRGATSYMRHETLNCSDTNNEVSFGSKE